MALTDALLAVVDAITATLQLNDFGVMEEAVEQDAGGDVVTEHGAEVFDGGSRNSGAGLNAKPEP